MALESTPKPEEITGQSGGFCASCRRHHYIGRGNTPRLAKQLMTRLAREKNVDLFSGEPAQERLSTRHLYSSSRGKMFGILECRNTSGATTTLYGFSGQYNGQNVVKGWVPPIYDTTAFIELTKEREKQIKSLTEQLKREGLSKQQQQLLKVARKELSRDLMKKIHSLYRLTNFRQETRQLSEIFLQGKGIPTGTGDCCAPKLLHFAAISGLRPVGMIEFFWGRETKSASQSQGNFYLPCSEKCQPLLGYLLCGLESYPMIGTKYAP
jgi:hypothetical protein